MNSLWECANSFRQWVCIELNVLSTEERRLLSGDYLFIIDSNPRFIVMVEERGAWSVCLSNEDQFNYTVDSNCPIEVTLESIQNCISYSARTTITTDSKTLQMLLLGKLKAKIAFLTGRVSLSGDLPAFLKMVSLLKKHGVRAMAPTIENVAAG